MSKRAFMQTPRISRLPKDERERRWRQHAANAGQQFQVKERAPTALTPDPLAALVHTFPSCAVHYLQALENPFHLDQPACIPDLHAVPSKKIKAILRGNFEIGTNGDGFIVHNPQTKGNDARIIVASTSSWASTGGSTIVPTLGGLNTADFVMAKLPYPNTAFAATVTGGIEGRVVGTALRIRYTGREIDRGGQIVAFRDPDNENVTSVRTFQQLKDFETSRTYEVSRDWVTVNYRPTRPAEFEYSRSGDLAGTDPISGPAVVRWSQGFTIQGAVPGSPFEFEVVSFVEYLGNIDNVTHTHSDIVAMSYIRNATPSSSSTKHPHMRLMKSAITIGKEIVKHSSPMVKESITSSGSHGLLSAIGSGLSNAISSAREGLDSFNSGFMQTVSNGLLSGLTNKLGGSLSTMLPEISGSGFFRSAAALLPEMVAVL